VLPIQALLSLPLIKLTIETSSNEDWLDSIGYTTPSDDPAPGSPIPLDGILLILTVRDSVDDLAVLLTASTENGLLQILPANSGSGINSVWMIAVYQQQFPALLVPGSYVLEMQGIVGQNRRTIVEGTLTVDKGVSP
jgi:hypothetical protein